MDIKQINNIEEWNGFVKQNHGSFLQSYEWGQFQKKYGREVQYLGVCENQKIMAGTLLIKYPLPLSKFYFFSPYGPVVHQPLLFSEIKKQAAKEKVIFWRYEHQILTGSKEVKDVHPKYTWMLNLQNKTSEQLLKEMKPKTRYNIRLAEKKGVEVRTSTDLADINIFYGLIQQTADRQKIGIFPKKYYQTMLSNLASNGFLKIYLAEYQGQVLAANLMVFFNKTVTYLHGGTSYEHHEVMAPQLLQWQAIQDAVHGGYHEYDFFGIAENDNPQHPWAGITRFKKGFGGQSKKYSGTYEISLNKIWYNIYYIVKKIKP